MESAPSVTQTKKSDGSAATRQTLTITDNRTGKSYEVPITHDTIRAADLRQIKVEAYGFRHDELRSGLHEHRLLHQYGHLHRRRRRASCAIAATPSSNSPKRAPILEIAYLLLYGELPNADQLKTWTYDITHHTFIHENIKKFIDGFHYDAHPMGMLISTIGALSTFYHDAKDIFRRRVAQKADLSPYRQDADHRGFRLSPLASACPMCIPTTISATPATS